MRIEDIDRRQEKRIRKLCHEIDSLKRNVSQMTTRLEKLTRKKTNEKRETQVKELETNIANHRKTIESTERKLKGVCK